MARRPRVKFRFVRTVRCRNPSLEGLEGLVIEETKNTLHLLTPSGSRKIVAKEDCWFYINQGNCTLLVPGAKLRN